MKRITKKICAAFVIMAALILYMAGPAAAVDAIFCKSMTGTTAAGTLTGADTYGAYVVIPGDNNSQVVATSLSATSDTAADHILIYDKENSANINATASATDTTISIASGGTSFDNGDLIVIQNPSGSVVFLEKITGAPSATSLTVTALDYDITEATGWKVYEMESIANIPCGAATASYQSDVAVAAGTRDSPVLLVVGGTSACSINFASGTYK